MTKTNSDEETHVAHGSHQESGRRCLGCVLVRGDCVADVVRDLRIRYESSPYEFDITEGVVEEFYQDWRAHFLGRVLRQIEELE